MPKLSTGSFNIDYIDEGEGPVVVLVHGAASNNKQWRQLIEDNRGQFRFLAINLFGYGETSPWPHGQIQSMSDQVALVEALCAIAQEPLCCLIGHSFGGAVAASAASKMKENIEALVLLEPNPFPLLEVSNKAEGYKEIMELYGFLKRHGELGDWESVAERFVSYWLGAGAWSSLSAGRQQAFIATLPNNKHEWDAVMNMDVSAAVWQGIKAKTLLVKARETKKSIEGIYEVFQDLCPQWGFEEVDEGGHMAPVTRPDLVNPMIMNFIKAVQAEYKLASL